MSTQFSTGNCNTGFCNFQSTTHKIALIPSIFSTSGATTLATLPMNTGENNYYIRCKNFAGQINAAEFAVKVTVAEGPDLTAPLISSFSPA